jgi:hypothetical protein
MRMIRFCALMVVAIPLVPQEKSSLPADINPVTLSRLPPVTAADLDPEAQRLLAARPNFKPGPGPAHISVYSPREIWAFRPVTRARWARGTFRLQC